MIEEHRVSYAEPPSIPSFLPWYFFTLYQIWVDSMWTGAFKFPDPSQLSGYFKYPGHLVVQVSGPRKKKKILGFQGREEAVKSSRSALPKVG